MSSKASLGGLRAREKVLAHLEEEFRKQAFPSGTRLPSSRELSRKLGVSVSTVQNVFQIFVKRGVIATEIGNGSFLINPPVSETKALRIGVTFGLLAGNQATDVWQLAISEAILQRIGEMGNASVYPINLARQSAGESLEILQSYRDKVDGIILKPIEGLPRLLKESSLHGFPIVHLNPPWVSATSNFVSADYLSGFLRVGEALVASGRKSIFCIESHPYAGLGNFSLITSGLVGAIGARIGKEIHYEMIVAESTLEEDGYRAAKAAFTNGEAKPDALVCAGDFLAVGARRYCMENGIRVPEEVSVVAGLGALSLAALTAGITQIRQPLGQIGMELVEMLCRQIRSGGRAEPGVYLPMDVREGASTTAAENRLLV